MMISAPVIAALLPLSIQAATDAPRQCTSPAIVGTSKAIYNLKPPSKPESPAIGDLTRTEAESYDAQGRRQRVEWIDPQGDVILAFVEFYQKERRPYGALYVEEGELTPTLEAFTWSADGRVKTVEYRTARGEVTGSARYFYDDQDREIKRQYGVNGDAFSSSDTVSWDGPNEVGYVWEKADGSARSVVSYTIEKIDQYGNWTQRSAQRDGAPTIREVRALTYGSPGC